MPKLPAASADQRVSRMRGSDPRAGRRGRTSAADGAGSAAPRLIEIPANALIVLVGPAAAGKSTFAREHFSETQIVSSDHCRALVGDDEAEQSVNAEAFVLLRTLVRLRLRLGRLTVVDSTALQRQHRGTLLRLGRAQGVPVIALLFDVDAATCKRRNQQRERRVPEDVLDLHQRQFRQALRTIVSEGFDAVHVLADAPRDGLDVTLAEGR